MNSNKEYPLPQSFQLLLTFLSCSQKKKVPTALEKRNHLILVNMNLIEEDPNSLDKRYQFSPKGRKVNPSIQKFIDGVPELKY